jgi:UDP:flavonoid glycosyltransferase YjiC (YdhE family)
MRVLISSGPFHGHLNTVLPLAHAARDAGHQVVVSTGPDLVPYVERHGHVAWASGPGQATGQAAGADVDWLRYFVTSAEQRAIDLVPRALAWRPHLVVHEETELAGAVAARATGGRHVVHGLGVPPPLRIWDAFAPALESLFSRWGLRGSADDVREATYLDICPRALRPGGEPIWPHALALRPAPGQASPGERLSAVLGDLRYPRTVHLTLGTVFHRATAVLEAAIAGLRSLPVNLVATVGPDGDPARFGPQPRHVVIERYLPHALLLPRCHLVVSHGGAGVLFGALAHGLPSLLLPQGADQPLNAEACERAGAALALRPGEVTADAVREAAARLLAEPAFATAAAAVGAELNARPGPAAVLARLRTERRSEQGSGRATAW